MNKYLHTDVRGGSCTEGTQPLIIELFSASNSANPISPSNLLSMKIKAIMSPLGFNMLQKNCGVDGIRSFLLHYKNNKGV